MDKKKKRFVEKPYYAAGKSAMQEFINDNLKYPKKALNHKVEGTVVLRYGIDKDGNVNDVTSISKLGYGLEEEAERVIRLLQFVMPRNRAGRLTFHKKINVHFRLPQAKPAAEKKEEHSYRYTVSKTSKQIGKAKSSKIYTYTIKL